MDDYEVYAARLELIDYLIEVFGDTPRTEYLEAIFGDELMVPEDEVNESLDEGFDLLETFVDANRGRPVADVQSELEQEYSRVFVGPRPPVLAHETYYRDDTEFIGKGLAEVEESYSAGGWKPPETYPEENDFIAVELAFLRNLIDRQRQGQVEVFGFQRVFLDQHFLAWVDDLSEDVLDKTDVNYYRAAAHILAGFAEFEDELVAQMVPG